MADLAEAPFSYNLNKSGAVLIYYKGKQARVIKGREAQRFLDKVEVLNSLDAQMLMARITGAVQAGE